MKVQAKELKNAANRLNKLVSTYESTYLNLYNELKKASAYGISDNFIRFFSDVESEKLKVGLIRDELKKTSKIYNFIADKYLALGNIIEFDLTKKDKVLSNISNCESKVNNLISNINSISVGLCPPVNGYISNAKSKANGLKQELIRLKRIITEYYEKIAGIEDEVGDMISKLDISPLQENSVEVYF